MSEPASIYVPNGPLVLGKDSRTKLTGYTANFANRKLHEPEDFTG